MKTIGIIGGMSWESSIEYYRIINEVTREKKGGLHSSKSVMVSVDFAPVEEMQKNAQWDEATDVMVNTANQVASGGADFIVIATNTMHMMYEAVHRAVDNTHPAHRRRDCFSDKRTKYQYHRFAGNYIHDGNGLL